VRSPKRETLRWLRRSFAIRKALEAKLGLATPIDPVR
jgi:hypothetical protein